MCRVIGSLHSTFIAAGDDSVFCVLKACLPLVPRELGARAPLQLWLFVAQELLVV